MQTFNKSPFHNSNCEPDCSIGHDTFLSFSFFFFFLKGWRGRVSAARSSPSKNDRSILVDHSYFAVSSLPLQFRFCRAVASYYRRIPPAVISTPPRRPPPPAVSFAPTISLESAINRAFLQASPRVSRFFRVVVFSCAALTAITRRDFSHDRKRRFRVVNYQFISRRE